MKTVLSHSLSIELFKGVAACNLRFDGCSAAVYGANGTGKSTVADAWTWLLFGKNSAGASDFSVKPLDESGAVLDHDAHTSVTAEITVDGEAHTLRRVYYEKWSHKRGAAQASFDGHTTDFYIDGVPRSKSEYDAAICALIAPEDVFILLSRLNAFCDALTWQKRRQVLFSLAGIGSDCEIMKTDERFIPLADAVGSATLDEFRRRLTSENKRYNEERAALTGRMEEAVSMAREMRTHEAETVLRSASERQAEAACELTGLMEKRESLRAQYTAFADAPLSMGEAVCPTCGRSLDEAARRTAAERVRQNQLQAIADEGKRLNERIGVAERNLAKYEAALSAAERELERAKTADATDGDTVAAKRIEELNARAREIGDKQSENERLLFLADDFMRYKVSLIEDSVNKRFRLACFKLFDEKINGSIAECCTVTHDGVPYADVNTSMRVNVALDIIGVISEHYGVSVPLFCDNAESVSEWEQLPSQTVKLYVSERDTELRVEREGM